MTALLTALLDIVDVTYLEELWGKSGAAQSHTCRPVGACKPEGVLDSRLLRVGRMGEASWGRVLMLHIHIYTMYT